MDFFKCHYKLITIGWLLLVFAFWLVPRIVVVDDYLLVDSAPVGIFYLTLFEIAIAAFILIVLVELFTTKNFKLLKRFFLIILLPITLLAGTGVYRWLVDWGHPCRFLDTEQAKKHGVFYAEYDVSPKQVSVNDTIVIHFNDAVGQYCREKDRLRLFDFPKYIKSDRKCIILNCSTNNSSSAYRILFWKSDDAYNITGPRRYGKKGKPFIDIPLNETASDTIWIAINNNENSDTIDSICLIKRT